MIYERVAADLSALADRLPELGDLLRLLNEELSRMRMYDQIATIDWVPGLPGVFEQGLRTRAKEVSGLTNINDVVTAGLTAFRGYRRRMLEDIDAPVATAARDAKLSDEENVRRIAQIVKEFVEHADQAAQGLEEVANFPTGPGYNLGRISSTVDDIASYPILTSGDGGGPVAPTSPAGPDAVQSKVDGAIRALLGRLPKYTDNTSFVSALTSSFALTEVQGHTVATWQPRTYLGQSELGGGVTGAQASVYSRACDSLKAVLPLVKSLRPLRPDADEQEMDSARSMLESQFRAVVDELGTEGGPRPARVEQLFAALLDQTVMGIDNVPVRSGVVGYVQTTFGFQPEQVNTVEEEQAYSDFLLVRDYIKTTRASWCDFFTHSFGHDLGTRLVLLSNALQVVAESVDEVEAALDSVYVGQGERSVAAFRMSTGGDMLVSELLTWVTSFASQEARELVLSGHRRAMGIIADTADRLDGLVDDLIRATGADPRLPRGMRHPRVRHPLEELRTYLQRVMSLAQNVRVSQTSTP